MTLSVINSKIEHAEKSSSRAIGSTQLIAVSKVQPNERVLNVLKQGHTVFGENKVQEAIEKWEEIKKKNSEIKLHMIGKLQTNKVKFIQPITKLIHGVDSEKLLMEINKQATKNNSISNILLQIYIAQEESKFGLDENELTGILEKYSNGNYSNVRIKGLMGMASFTADETQIQKEFKSLADFFQKLKNNKTGVSTGLVEWTELSMGMSGDYLIAAELGATLVRVGSAIYGPRH